VERSGRDLILGDIPVFAWRDEKIHEKSQVTRSVGRYLNPGSPEYGAGVLTAQSWRSVWRYY
jgi:hypothetical protein